MQRKFREFMFNAPAGSVFKIVSVNSGFGRWTRIMEFTIYGVGTFYSEPTNKSDCILILKKLSPSPISVTNPTLMNLKL